MSVQQRRLMCASFTTILEEIMYAEASILYVWVYITLCRSDQAILCVRGFPCRAVLTVCREYNSVHGKKHHEPGWNSVPKH